jgi:hypothetical protein
MLLVLFAGTGCVFSDDDGTPDAVVVDDNDPPASNTTIIDHDTTPAPDADVDVNVTP